MLANEGCCAIQARANITEELMYTAECLRGTQYIIDEITGKLEGHRKECLANESAPPELGIREWAEGNHKAAESIRSQLSNIMDSL